MITKIKNAINWIVVFVICIVSVIIIASITGWGWIDYTIIGVDLGMILFESLFIYLIMKRVEYIRKNILLKLETQEGK